MASLVATRRSPRSIKALCNGILIPNFDYELTATFLSLAHCSGWSADQIARKSAGFTGVILFPELVWDYHWIWVHGHDTVENISTSEWETMQCLMRAVEVNMEGPDRPLSRTFRPKTIKFATEWSAKSGDGSPLFSGYTAEIREATKAFLHVQRTEEAFGKLTPIEELVLHSFGESMLNILRKAFKKWAEAMWDQVRSQPIMHLIREKDHVDLIMQHLKAFHKYRDSCPTCRFQFPDAFLEKIFSRDEWAARVAKDSEVDLASPSPEPVEYREPIRSQQEQDAIL